MPAMSLFAYGTLQDEDVLAALLGRPAAIATLPLAIARDFKAVAYPGRVYPALVACPGAAAPGRLIAPLTPLDLAVLDGFEGDEYRRAALTVQRDGVDIPAQAYLPVIDIPADGPAWSLAHWLAHHKAAALAGETGTARDLRQRFSALLA